MPETNNFDALKKVIDRYGKEFIKDLQAELIKKNKVASKRLLNSLKYEIKQGLTDLQLIISGEEYFKYLEKGRKPGKFVPIKVLKDWCQLKGININSGAPYAINWKIYRFGIAPTSILPQAIDSFKNKIFASEDFENEFKKSIEQSLDKIIEKHTFVFSEE